MNSTPRKNSFPGAAVIAAIDELRQEGHEEQHDLGVEQVDAHAGQKALPQRRRLLRRRRNLEAAACAIACQASQSR